MDQPAETQPTTRGSPRGGLLTMILAPMIPIAAIVWGLDLPRSAGLLLYTEQMLCGVLALAILLVYLESPARAGARSPRPTLFDWLFGLAGFAAAGYMAVDYQNIADMMPYRPLHLIVVAVVLLVSLVEALRRVGGWGLAILVASFIAYAFFGNVIPGPLSANQVNPQRLAIYLTMDPNSLLGIPLIIAAVVVSVFILFGNLLSAAGGSRFFTDLSMAAMGRYRGGAAKIAVVGSAFFGSVSGSAVANVMATGVVTVPIMVRSGFPKRTAAAIEAVASTGGQLVPPVMGAAAFLMAEFMQVPYGQIVLAALIPAFLYYGSLFICVDLEAARRGILGLDPRTLPSGRSVMFRGWFFIVPFAVLIGALFWLNESPEKSVLYGTAIVILLGVFVGYGGDRLRIGSIWGTLTSAGLASRDIIIICAAAGIVIGVLNISGSGFKLTLELVRVGEANTFALLILAAFLCILLGMGMPSTGVYVLLAALVVPGLIRSGIDPFAAHLFIFYFGMLSMITPPIALAAFAAASISGAKPMATGFAACRIGWAAFIVPFLFALSPALVAQAGGMEIALAVATGIVGIWFICAGVIGFSVRRIAALQRGLYGAAGLLLLVHISADMLALIVHGAGLALGVALVMADWRARKTDPVAEQRPSAEWNA